MQDYWKQQQQQQEKTGIITFASGLAMVVVILVVQHLSVSSLISATGTITLSEEQSTAFRNAALPTFVIILIATGISLVGVLQMLSWCKLTRRIKGTTIFHRTKRSISDGLHKQKTAFWLALLIYGIIFLFASNTMIYSAERISERYGVNIPSYSIIGCCGQPGSFPVLTVYLSEHMGLLLIPSNIMLLSYLPLFVAINTAIIINKVRISKKEGARVGKNISFCGISAGLLAGCPTCAGSIVLSLFGVGSSSAAAAVGLTAASAIAASYQPLFAIASIIALIAAPLIMELKQQS
ncbi:MAG: hypothetical protein M3299_09965 [Thermoproteota archaeon]|nr:hypothetical protein [Thermoproteota archaeon]